MIRKVCEQCGSEDLAFDAVATWNVEAQEFDFNLIDTVWCEECKDTVFVVDKEIIYRKGKKL